MDKTLKTLHLRLDSTSKSLTKNAISQLIIKILYAQNKPLLIQEIEKELKVTLRASINSDRIAEGIRKLIQKEEIKYEKKKYRLTRSNRRILDKRYSESNERLNRIVNNYFSPTHSDKSTVKDWLSDITIEFFNSYSKEWTSDLCYTSSKKLETKKEDIFKHIERRTKNNKDLNKNDYKNLIENFIEFIIYKKDSDIDAFLWEYGTSSFAANLLQASIGADPISISAFKDSKCIMDTNVLMNIGLEGSEYSGALKKLDKVFVNLNIIPGFFHTTRHEYINTVSNLNEEILRNVSKFSYSVIKETDDQFIKSAIKRECHTYDDFERFCNQISLPPKYIYSEKEIVLFDDDTKLEQKIELAQSDDKKLKELNAIFNKVTGHDKREAALIHDVGLIAGTEYYRTNEKAFILSQEISINKYSHSKPTIENLPLAIKLETLINMLAIDNGGTDVDPTDFSTLFASMIRLNLQPEQNTFKITDLSKLLDTELQIEQLPSNEIITIANKLHENIGKGLSSEEIGLELNRQFQEVKLRFVDDLDTAKEKLTYEKGEKERFKNKASKTRNALRKRIEIEEFKGFEKKILTSKLIWYFIIPLLFTALVCLGIYFTTHTDPLSNSSNYLIAVFINVVIWLLGSLIVTKPKLRKNSELLKKEIEHKIDNRLMKEIE